VELAQWPLPLRARLGDEAATALAEVLDARDEAVLSTAAERFERRLTEEGGSLRVSLRGEMETLRTELRGEMETLRTELRSEMEDLRTELRGEMHLLRSDVKIDLANARADLLKWSFLFWVGQVAAVTGLVTLLR
jgi:hypothetical protein